jgi:hypothetical protein
MMRRVQEYLVEKNLKIPMSKISTYSHLCTEERIHDEESPGITWWKKNLKIPMSKISTYFSVQKKESTRTGESRVPQCYTLSCSLFISMNCMSKSIHTCIQHSIPLKRGKKMAQMVNQTLD